MHGSVTSTVSDPDEYYTALPADGSIRMLFTASGRFRGRSTEVRMGHVHLVSYEESLPRIAFVEVPPDRLLVGLSVTYTDPPTWSGTPVTDKELIALGPGKCAHMRSEAPCRWGAIWLPVPVFAYYGRALTGKALDVPSWLRHWRSPPTANQQFRALYLAAIQAAQTASDAATGAEAAHGLEQQLIYFLTKCLTTGSVHQAALSTPRKLEVMARFEKLIRTHPESTHNVVRVSAALGVSDRFLRQCCAQHLRMSPAEYIRLHQLQLARHALRNGPPETMPMDKVAHRFGFRSLAHFAREYRELYGEAPTETLQRDTHRDLSEIVPVHDQTSGNSRNCD